jgi:hypothetical protein
LNFVSKVRATSADSLEIFAAANQPLAQFANLTALLRKGRLKAVGRPLRSATPLSGKTDTGRTLGLTQRAFAERYYQAPKGSWHLHVGLRNKSSHRVRGVREQRCLANQQGNDEHNSDH